MKISNISKGRGIAIVKQENINGFKTVKNVG